MYKIVTSSVLALMLIGCSSEKGVTYKSTMFQSVNEKEAVLLQDGKNKNYCYKCGMDLVKYYKTSHSATDNSKTYQYCSIHCLEGHLNDGVVLKNPKVVDVESLKFIDSTKAYYVVGSKKSATMSRISKYAFYNEDMAKKIQYVRRDAIKKIVAAWLITVPAAAVLAGMLFFTIKGIMI